jgi:hypothetical protein
VLDREKIGIEKYNSSPTMETKVGKPLDPKYLEKQDRMKMYGFTRDPRDVRAI